MEIFRLGVLAVVLCASLAEAVDISITPREVNAGTNDTVKITCTDKKYSSKVYSVTISRNNKDLISIEPPRNANWLDSSLERRASVINTNVRAGNVVATLHLTTPHGWDTGLYTCTVQKAGHPESSKELSLKVNGSSMPRMDVMLGFMVAAHMVFAVARS